MPDITPFHNPPDQSSNEADPPQLALAKKQGSAVAEAIRYMANKVADRGGERKAGKYVVTYALEEAEGLFSSSR